VPLLGSWVPIEHNVAKAEAYTQMPSFILIHPTVWSQYTNVTVRQDRIDKTGQRSDSIGQTILQTIAQKFSLKPWVILPKTAIFGFL